MKKIQLTRNKYTIIDDEDYEHLNQFNWYTNKSRNTYYAVRKDYKLNKTFYLHREIMNCPDDMFIDHINRNGLDNRKFNLRICTNTENLGNSKLRKDNTSGMKGVGWDKDSKKWKARIGINNKRIFLGYFTNKLKAKDAYTKAAKQYFGEFASDGIR